MADPLSLDEHRALGLELARLHDRLVHLHVEIANREGKTSKAARRADRAEIGLSNLRSELDNIVARRYPGDFAPTIYYPSQETRGAEPVD